MEGCHEITEKSSKIVSLGAPLLSAECFSPWLHFGFKRQGVITPPRTRKMEKLDFVRAFG